jgi:hypothetical protein
MIVVHLYLFCNQNKEYFIYYLKIVAPMQSLLKGAKMDSDFIKIEYHIIDSEEKMALLVDEMKQFARNNPFDHQKVIQEVENKNVTTEKHGSMVRVRGFDPTSSFNKYNRFVCFGHASVQTAFQLAYTEGYNYKVGGIVCQLTTVNNKGFSLDDEFVEFLSSWFFEEGENVGCMDTPPHVSVLISIRSKAIDA